LVGSRTPYGQPSPFEEIQAFDRSAALDQLALLDAVIELDAEHGKVNLAGRHHLLDCSRESPSTRLGPAPRPFACIALRPSATGFSTRFRQDRTFGMDPIAFPQFLRITPISRPREEYRPGAGVVDVILRWHLNPALASIPASAIPDDRGRGPCPHASALWDWPKLTRHCPRSPPPAPISRRRRCAGWRGAARAKPRALAL